MRRKKNSKKRRTIKNGNKNKAKRNKGCFQMLFSSLLLLYIFGKLAIGQICHCMLDKYSEITFGKVTRERHFKPNGMLREDDITYGYKIRVDGKIYRGDSNIRGLVIGQQIEVEYLPSFPYFHRYSRKKEAD